MAADRRRAAREEFGQQAAALVGAHAAGDPRVMVEPRLGEEVDRPIRTRPTSGSRRAEHDARDARVQIAPAHIAHGSSVVKSSQPVKPIVADRRAQRRAARAISACAVGSLPAMGALPPRPMIAPSRTTTAPTGTSPRVRPRARASASASPIQASSLVGSGIFDVEAWRMRWITGAKQDAGGAEHDQRAEDRVDAVEPLAAIG